MENYLVSARKYRPSTFDSVVGQKALTLTLRNAIATNKLAHAYLFCGSRGVGKTSCARIFAKTINCENPTPDGNPCNECESCRSFNEGRSLNIVELDAASNNGVEDIRQLTEQVQVLPTNGKYRVFIIDEVHMLSSSAFNAFLKTLEEPPSYVVFILATTEKHKILPTILSRCQIYDFNRITVSDIVDHLEYVARQEGYTAERPALSIIAQKADGAMRDALSIFDQVAASSRGNITYRSTIENLNVLDESYYTRLMEAFLSGNVPQALLIYKEIRDKGFDSHFFINGLASFLRDLMLAQTPATLDILDADENLKKQMTELAMKCPPQFFYAAMSLCNEADLNYRQASNKTFLVELLLIRLCQQLSPSLNYSDDGEGRLKPIVAEPQESYSAPQQQQKQESAPKPQTTPEPQQKRAVNIPPPPPPKATQPAVRRKSPLMSGPSLRDLKKGPDTTQQQTAAPTRATRTNAYTDEAVIAAWRDYMNLHPKEQVLVNTMRASMPERVKGDTFRITVENHAQTMVMSSQMPDLLAFIHNQLMNDLFRIEITENHDAGSPHTWNDRELLNHIVEQNPAIRDLINSFKLVL
ncbi:MAG: DNA polymerase III subunit gamma/tau [Muribaculaceae bacterium]|nr:DNA polymerase III subunit gamma/tau [Muribaculaceae bacterium]